MSINSSVHVNNLSFILGTQVGRVKVIFKLPTTLNLGVGVTNTPAIWPKEPLVYVEWYSQFKSSKETERHGMYVVKKGTRDANGISPGSIIPLTNIRQSCMLIPKFRTNEAEEASWTSSNVLDQASTFYVNNWLNLYSYQTIW